MTKNRTFYSITGLNAYSGLVFHFLPNLSLIQNISFIYVLVLFQCTSDLLFLDIRALNIYEYRLFRSQKKFHMRSTPRGSRPSATFHACFIQGCALRNLSHI